MGQNQESHAFNKEWKAEIVDLPGSNFEGMVQDSSGFMWIGTGEGLLRYDGFRYKTFIHEPDNPNFLSSSDISRLCHYLVSPKFPN
jgi:ligand-binding sensor domain-containing protein